MKSEAIGDNEIYSRCFYYIIICRKNVAEDWGKEPLRILIEFAKDVCQRLRSHLLDIALDQNSLKLLVEIPADMSADYFLCSFYEYCMCWEENSETSHLGLMPQCVIEAVSPDDIGVEHAQNFDPIIKFEIRDDAMRYLACNSANSSAITHPWHHIIITTLRAKMSLNLKFRLLLQRIITEICTENGLANVDCCMRRNHVHILCQSHVELPIAPIVERIKRLSMVWMRTNIHFHKVEGWADKAIVHTVSHRTLTQELSDLHHQDQIHPRFELQNEMSLIYQKLQIPYIFSLH